MRVFSAVGATAVAVAATALLAPVASADAPGDNGTIKIHDAKTGEELVKNEPHVCTFYLDAFFFDGRQQAAWEIDTQAPTRPKGAKADEGSLTLDGDGHGRSADISLPDGHYKLRWNFDKEHGNAKQKVFWVDCPAAGGSNGGTTGNSNGGANGGSGGTNGGSGGGSSSGGATGGSTGGTGSTGGGTVSGGTTPSTGADTATASASVSASVSASGVAAAAGSSGTPGNGSLASTGTSVIGVSALAAALLAGGVAVRFRRKGAPRRHV